MTEQDLQVFKDLFRKYCNQKIRDGYCEPDCCDICPIDAAYDEIFNGE